MHVCLPAAPVDGEAGKLSGELTTAATLALPLDSADSPEPPLPPSETPKALHVNTGRHMTDTPSTWMHSSTRRGGGGDGDTDEVSTDDEGDCESVPCDETETGRSYAGSFDSEARSYHHVFGGRCASHALCSARLLCRGAFFQGCDTCPARRIQDAARVHGTGQKNSCAAVKACAVTVATSHRAQSHRHEMSLNVWMSAPDMLQGDPTLVAPETAAGAAAF